MNWRRSLGLCLLLLTAAGCAASGRASLPVEEAPDAAPAGEIAAAAEAAPATLTRDNVTVIEQVRLAEQPTLGGDVRVEILATGSVNYTSYEPEPDRFIVEIPNVSLGALPDTLPVEEAGIKHVRIQAIPSSGGGSHARFEFVGEGVIKAQVVPRGSTLAVNLAAEPAPGLIGDLDPVPAEVTAPAAMPESPATVMQPKPLTEPEERPAAPRPVYPASEVNGVIVGSESAGARVTVVGDGYLSHRSFTLVNPDRLVLDIDGVVNRVPEKRIEVATEPLQRVRVAQFRTQPEQIVRVVLDLTEPTDYEILEDGAGLSVMVGAAAVLAREEAPASPDPVQVASVEMTQPEVTAESPAFVPAPLPVEVPSTAEPEILLDDIQPEPMEEVPAPAETITAPASLPDLEPRLVPSSPLDLGKDVVLFDRSDPSAGDEGVGRLIPAGTTFQSQTIAGERMNYRGERISVTFRDADIREVFFFFADIMKMNIVLDPDVSGKVDIRLIQIPWDQAFSVILRNQGLDAMEEDRVIRIARTQKLRAEAAERRALKQAQEQEVDPITFTRRLSYAKVQDAVQILQQVKSERGKIVADQRTNTLIISDIPDKREEYEALIGALDTQTPQVSIEARIVEAIRDFDRSLGIDWNFTGRADTSLGTQTNLTFPHNAEFAADVNLSSPSQAGTLGLALGNVLDSVTLDLQLDAFEADGKVRILSAPKVVTQNNQPATIEQGTQIPVVTTTATEIEVQYVPASLRLIVTPQITAEQTVIMKVIVENNQPSDTVSVGDTPGITTERVDTQILVRSGTTAVIGGVYKLSEAETETGIPGLRRIPFFGWLFKNKSFTKNSAELLVFLTPKIITNV